MLSTHRSKATVVDFERQRSLEAGLARQAFEKQRETRCLLVFDLEVLARPARQGLALGQEHGLQLVECGSW